MELGSDGNLEVLCLQKRLEFVDQAVELLNNEWPRSKTARLRSIEQGSAEGLPTSLVLIDKTGGQGKEMVLAHSKISPVPSDPSLCFVESVVVARNLRGKGYGRLIMSATEEFVKQKGIRTVYLTTFDQQPFYSKLGYSLCDPIVVFGGGSRSLTQIVSRNMESLRLNNSPCNPSSPSRASPSSTKQLKIPSSSQSQPEGKNLQVKNGNSIDIDTPERKSSAIVVEPSLPVAPPPPPPPPPKLPSKAPLTKDKIVLLDKDVKVTMRKVLF